MTPRVEVEYCTGCGFLLRAAWLAAAAPVVACSTAAGGVAGEGPGGKSPACCPKMAR